MSYGRRPPAKSSGRLRAGSNNCEMSVEILIQVAIGGVLVGGLYALFAFGLSLIYGVARILNFAHGTLLAISGVLGSIMFVSLGSTVSALFISLSVLSGAFFVFGWVFNNLLLDPLKSRSHFEMSIGTILVTVGALIIISDLASALAGPRPRNILIRSGILEFGDVIIPTTQAYMLVGIIGLTFGLHVLLQRSWYGRAIRAVTQDHIGATICGIRSNMVHGLTFGIGCALAAFAGVLYATIFPIAPYSGLQLTVKAFTIIVLGGIGNLPGALAAGLFLGVAEAFTAFFWGSEWAPALSIVLLLLILIVFPRGIASLRRS